MTLNQSETSEICNSIKFLKMMYLPHVYNNPLLIYLPAIGYFDLFIMFCLYFLIFSINLYVLNGYFYVFIRAYFNGF